MLLLANFYFQMTTRVNTITFSGEKKIFFFGIPESRIQTVSWNSWSDLPNKQTRPYNARKKEN